MPEPLLFSRPDVARENRADGTIVLRSRRPMPTTAASVLEWLEHWSSVDPDRPLIAERGATGWRTISFGVLRGRASRLASGFRQAGLAPGDRLLTLAPNGAAHLSVAMACYVAGLIYVPVARQYGAEGADSRRLDDVMRLVKPAALYLDRASVTRLRQPPLTFGPDDLDDLASGGEHPRRAVDVNTPAKILMTSGSSGPPKAVVQTQAMMTANMAMTLAAWPFATARPPVLIDWLPWNHSFGGNHILHMVLACGGTLHVDDGGVGAIERTAHNIRDVRPTFYAAVPAGYEALLPLLERDGGLRDAFFARLDLMFSAGAAMSRPTWERLRRLSSAARGAPVPISAGWGATELGPGATMVHAETDDPASLGTPLPGVTVKLTPVGDKFELRVKSPSVTPGYWRDEVRTAQAFDEDGFYRSGDAGLPTDEADPNAGLLFDGRIADDFKLANGSWVNVARIRAALIAAGVPHVRDVVLLAPSKPVLGALFWLSDGGDARALDAVVARHNAEAIGATTRVVCWDVLDEPPSEAAGEIGDKGQIRASALRERRAKMIDELYARQLQAAA